MAGEKIFISHSHFDTPFCERLYTWLTATMGMDAFYDREQLQSGDDWLDRIQTELEGRPIFLLVLSKHSVVATWVRAETRLALDLTFSVRTHRIIPISIDPTLTRTDISRLSSFLHLFQQVDLSPEQPPDILEAHWQSSGRVISGTASERATDKDALALAPQAERSLALANEVHEAFHQELWHDVMLFAQRALVFSDNTRDERIYAELAQAQYRLGEQQNALANLRHALEINEFRGDYWQILARWLMAQDAPDIEAAQLAWENAYVCTHGREKREQILREQVQWLLALGQWDKALKVCQRGVQFDATSVEWQGWKRQAEDGIAGKSLLMKRSLPDMSFESYRTPGDIDKLDFFTERAHSVLHLAENEARRFEHNYIGSEHLLLGLVREGNGVAGRVLAKLGIELGKVRSAVEFIIGRGDHVESSQIGLTPRSKTILQLAVDEARRLNHHYVGTEHLLLGMVREGEGIAAGVLEALGVNLERVRAAVIEALKNSGSSENAEKLSIPQALEALMFEKDIALQHQDYDMADLLHKRELEMRGLLSRLTESA